MTDPTIPNHDQPVEGSRSDDTGSNTGAKASDMLETIRDAVEDFAEKAAPVVRQFSAKAAEVVASAADKAVPLAQKAGEATADASGKLAVKSRSWAADVRESLSDNGTTDKTEPPTTF
jgi:hypothetical protein